MKIRAHETFSIRKGWLHKGAKNILVEPRLFTNKEINPCDKLGIGTNMVKSLRYWMTTVGIMNEVQEGNQKIQRLSELGKIINDNDKYYEEDGTYWMLHYLLATNEDQATAWYWFFNEFKANTFDKEFFVAELAEFLQTKYSYSCSPKMVEDEFDCIIKTYCTKDKEVSPEDTNECPFVDLHLIEYCGGKDYRKAVPEKRAIHPLIAFGVICNQLEDNKKEILIADLFEKKNSIGRVFNLDRSTLYYILEQLQKLDLISIARTAGLDIIKIKKKATLTQALQSYYNDINGVK